MSNLIEYRQDSENDGIMTPHSPFDLPLEQFKSGLERREANRKQMIQWIAKNLVRGTDFGSIHTFGKARCKYGVNCTNPTHWSKPSLFKPGAEKICGMLGLTPRFANHDKYEQAAYSGTRIFQVILKCELHTDSGYVAGEGIGARVLDKDSGDINKSLKMAEKSAMIDAVLRVAGLSEIFTQDIEDMKMGERELSPQAQPTQPEPSKAKSFMSQRQKNLIFRISSSHLFSDDERKTITEFCSNPQKSVDAGSKMIDWLKEQCEIRKSREAEEEAPEAELIE